MCEVYNFFFIVDQYTKDKIILCLIEVRKW